MIRRWTFKCWCVRPYFAEAIASHQLGGCQQQDGVGNPGGDPVVMLFCVVERAKHVSISTEYSLSYQECHSEAP